MHVENDNSRNAVYNHCRVRLNKVARKWKSAFDFARTIARFFSSRFTATRIFTVHEFGNIRRSRLYQRAAPIFARYITKRRRYLRSSSTPGQPTVQAILLSSNPLWIFPGSFVPLFNIDSPITRSCNLIKLPSIAIDRYFRCWEIWRIETVWQWDKENS